MCWWTRTAQEGLWWESRSRYAAYTRNLNWFMRRQQLFQLWLGRLLALKSCSASRSMTFPLGLKAPLNFSVFTGSAAAFLLGGIFNY